MELRMCSKCNENKNIDQFKLDSNMTYCKSCKIEYDKMYYSKNKDKFIKDPLLVKEYNASYYINNKEELKYKKKYKWDIIKEYNRVYSNIKYNNNPIFKLRKTISNRIRRAINNNSKKSSTIMLLCCTIEEFKLYLESLFLPEMNWGNYGEIWEIDHIIPCISFDLTKLEEQEKCFHYKNHQPLFKTTEIALSFGYKDQIGNKNKGKIEK